MKESNRRCSNLDKPAIANTFENNNVENIATRKRSKTHYSTTKHKMSRLLTGSTHRFGLINCEKHHVPAIVDIHISKPPANFFKPTHPNYLPSTYQVFPTLVYTHIARCILRSRENLIESGTFSNLNPAPTSKNREFASDEPVPKDGTRSIALRRCLDVLSHEQD